MDKKRMKRMIGIAIPRALIITGISYNGYIRTHTFTLSGGVVKNELIQPINNKIKVSGNADTDVIFTDIESRKQYTIRMYHILTLPFLTVKLKERSL